MDKRDKTLLGKISDEMHIIDDLINGYDCNSFVNDEKTKRAVCMTLVNIGEMVKLMSDNIKQSNPLIPWRLIAGLRDVTAHGYQTLRMGDIWETISDDIPKLQKSFKTLLGE